MSPDIDVFHRDPGRFLALLHGDRFHSLAGKLPNRAHRALAQLEQAGLLRAVVTQNIDRLHYKAGSRELIEVHGTIDHSRLECARRYPLEEVSGRIELDAERVPRCDCGQALKPDVVLFGEYLPPDALARAERLALEADLLLCVGSSARGVPGGGTADDDPGGRRSGGHRHPGADGV